MDAQLRCHPGMTGLRGLQSSAALGPLTCGASMGCKYQSHFGKLDLQPQATENTECSPVSPSVQFLRLH